MSKLVLGLIGVFLLIVGGILASISAPSYGRILIACIILQVVAVGVFWPIFTKTAWPLRCLPLVGILIALGILTNAALRL